MNLELESYLGRTNFWVAVNHWHAATPGPESMTLADKIEQQIIQPIWDKLSPEDQMSLIQKARTFV